MTSFIEINKSFRDSARGGSPLIGIFVKTFDPAMIEMIALNTTVNFIVLDLEHSPCDLQQLSMCILAARSGSLPVIVRPGGFDSNVVGSSLDLGGSGVMFPRISEREQALSCVKSTRFSGGSRGFSLSHRAASYGGLPKDKFVTGSDESTLVAVQLEDLDAVKNSGDIAEVGGVDVLFIGPADLSLAIAMSPDSSMDLDTAIEEIISNVKMSEKPLGIYCPDLALVDRYLGLGFSFFIISTDQELLGSAINSIAREFESRF